MARSESSRIKKIQATKDRRAAAMARGQSLTADEARRVLDYNRETGALTWKVSGARFKAGDVAGSPSEGYYNICINYRLHKAHRLAWLMHYGLWPDGQVDHIDGNRGNNAIANLREATNRQNGRNRPKQRNNSSGYKGVSPSNGKWRAQITTSDGYQYIGTFDTPELAHAAYLEAASRHFGEFARE